MAIHLIKLIVGIDSLSALAQWQRKEYTIHKGQRAGIIHTRNQPRHAQEILEHGGSIYRVIQGHILCRQTIVGFEATENAKRGKHCLILVNTDIMRTYPTPQRAFQGWRYLDEARAPEDTGLHTSEEATDESTIENELRTLGLL